MTREPERAQVFRAKKNPATPSPKGPQWRVFGLPFNQDWVLRWPDLPAPFCHARDRLRDAPICGARIWAGCCANDTQESPDRSGGAESATMINRLGQSGLGLEAQRSAVLGYLNGGSWTMVAEFTEVESGKHADRPQLAAALAACKKHKAKLVIAKLDRLSRNLAFIATLMDSAVEFVAVDC
jgi:hypothetical protein